MNLIKHYLSLTLKITWRIDYEQEGRTCIRILKRVSRVHPMNKNLAECSFMVGWDACMKSWARLPLDESLTR